MFYKIVILAFFLSLYSLAYTISYCKANIKNSDCFLDNFDQKSDFEIKCNGNKTLNLLILFPEKQIVKK